MALSSGPAASGSTVSVHYTGTLDDGSEFDSLRARGPLTFTLGDGQLLPDFEQTVMGMYIGETRTIHIEPVDAYGLWDEVLVIDFPRSEAPDGLQKGDEVRMANGTPATVFEITSDVVRMDFNHRLAGEALTFEIELLTIR